MRLTHHWLVAVVECAVEVGLELGIDVPWLGESWLVRVPLGLAYVAVGLAVAEPVAGPVVAAEQQFAEWQMEFVVAIVAFVVAVAVVVAVVVVASYAGLAPSSAVVAYAWVDTVVG